MSTGDARELQRELYGAPLGEVGADVMKALGLTQGRLAEALGLSAPMLSQLMTGSASRSATRPSSTASSRS